MIKKTYYIAFLILISLSCASEDKASVSVITFEEFQKQVIGKDVQLIDLRTDKEYNQGTIDDAVQMNFFEKDTFLKQIETLDKKKSIYIYCHSGGRSSRASKLLQEKGFQKIYDYSGGYSEWSLKSKLEK
tara:strand:- start:41707 stop:42096 length:390 start_codon:yes stop_codon:yes gene_type:complete